MLLAEFVCIPSDLFGFETAKPVSYLQIVGITPLGRSSSSSHQLTITDLAGKNMHLELYEPVMKQISRNLDKILWLIVFIVTGMYLLSEASSHTRFLLQQALLV